MALPCNPRPLVVLGASGRAMAHSATLAGIPVHAADVFGDADLLETCVSARRVARYPEGLLEASREFPPAAWCYVGGLENHCDVLATLAEERPLAGSPAKAVRMVRDPHWLAECCRRASLPMPETHDEPRGLPRDGTFLVKPLDGAGGHGIRPWRGEPDADRAERPTTPCRRTVWQRRLAGTPHSAVFVGSRGDARLLFTTRQLIGWPPCHGGEFAWCGGLTDRHSRHVLAALARLGECLATEAGLTGLFGVDFILTPGGLPVPLEVNPRPTASMELWDRACGESLAAVHLAACGFDTADPMATFLDTDAVQGKAILFAPAAVVATEEAFARWMRLRDIWRDPRGFPGIADIPVPGSSIAQGRPVLTVFAAGDDSNAVMESLLDRLATVEGVLDATALSRPSAGGPEPPSPDRDTP